MESTESVVLPAEQPFAHPRQGEVWLVGFGAAKTGEPGKTWPAIVVSADGQFTGSIYDLIAVVPTSSALSVSAVRPGIAASRATGLETDSVAVVRAIRAVSPARLLRRLGQVERVTLMAIREILDVVLDLPNRNPGRW